MMQSQGEGRESFIAPCLPCCRYIRRFESNHMTAAEMKNVGFPWSQQLVRGLGGAGCRSVGVESVDMESVGLGEHEGVFPGASSW